MLTLIVIQERVIQVSVSLFCTVTKANLSLLRIVLLQESVT